MLDCFLGYWQLCPVGTCVFAPFDIFNVYLSELQDGIGSLEQTMGAMYGDSLLRQVNNKYQPHQQNSFSKIC